jgi:hypothetical protein
MPYSDPGPYPIPSGGTGSNGPILMKFRQFSPTWDDVTDEHIYEDGGASYVSFNDTAPIIFLFEYPGHLLQEEAAILDEHYNDAGGKLFGFELTNPRTLEVFQDVHYLEREDDHEKTWMESRIVRLIKRPA